MSDEDILRAFGPVEARRMRQKRTVWQPIGELFIAAGEFHRFLTLFDAVLTMETEDTTTAFQQGYLAAEAFAARLHEDDFARGVAFAMRQVSAPEAVPAWVPALEAEIAARRHALREDLAAISVRVSASASADRLGDADPVH